jgi:hypothetical protein
MYIHLLRRFVTLYCGKGVVRLTLLLLCVHTLRYAYNSSSATLHYLHTRKFAEVKLPEAESHENAWLTALSEGHRVRSTLIVSWCTSGLLSSIVVSLVSFVS